MDKVVDDNPSKLHLENLIYEKLSKLDKNDPDYTKKLFKLESVHVKSSDKNVEKIELEIHSSIEKLITDSKISLADSLVYYAERAKFYKERVKYKENHETLSNEIQEYTSTNKETPTEYVESLLQTEMASYMDPED